MMDNQVNRNDIHSHRVEGSYIRTFWKKIGASFPGIRKRRLLTLTAASCCLLICSACGLSSPDTTAVPPRIALIAPAGTGELAEAIRLGAEAAAKESGAELITVEAYPSDGDVYTPAILDSAENQVQVKQANANLNSQTLSHSAREQAQVGAAASALKQGASALLVDPLSEKALSDIIQEAQTMNSDGTIVPVIVLNDEFPVKGITSFISMDNVEAGRQAGQAMAELLEGEGHVALLGPDPLNAGLVQREQGVMEALVQYPDIQVEPKSICNTRDGCWQTAKQLLDQQEVDGFITLQEAASLGAADELNRRNSADKIRIVGFGSEQQQLEQLQEGVFDHLIVQNGYSAGYLGVNQAVARLNNQQVQARVLLETKLVSTDNMFWMDNQKLLFPFVQ
ncbi:substrate-binding domain-containing protein [Paenibacillus sp. ClWae2A]|uniref:substrate-binding domain-containing protein n=1 Tax=Paenibacillus sp. ClWae2A TaxID=3057177 RepID=UPI0028F50BFD|nr:substrate-binding domain-containing protein [Paenibacillus sp. ClWae2A]MDT9720939.1 substrate-binding domain-containing protein [Paenibacillus sp. ClWae2A]